MGEAEGGTDTHLALEEWLLKGTLLEGGECTGAVIPQQEQFAA